MNFNQGTYRLFCAIIVCLAAIFGLNPSANAATWYVDGSLMPCGDGISWNTAYRYLQDALNNFQLAAGDEIWVAAGTYYVDQDCTNPAGTGDRTETFQLVKDVFLLGGFNGTELFAWQRDPILNETILSGNVATLSPPCAQGGNCFAVGGCDEADCCNRVCEFDPNCCEFQWDGFCADLAVTLCGEAFHVVTAGSEIDDTEKTVIDGFTIQDGTANGTDPLEDQGGGMLIRGEPSVVRCIFTQNTALERGGGIAIIGNAIQPDIINSEFHDNPGSQLLTAKNGGALASNQADASLVNCLFWANSVDENGGAIHNDVGNCSPAPTGPQCGRITLVNCTVYGNSAGTGGWFGGGLYGGSAGSIFDIDNAIFWANSPDQINGVNLNQSDVDFSDIQGGSPVSGMGNIDDYPEFVNLLTNDYRLTIISPCIDKGNTDETVIPCDFFNLDNDLLDCTPMEDERTPDLDLINRVVNGDLIGPAIVDMGSYEFIHPDSCPWDINGDEMVGAADLLFLLANWGTCVACGDCPADFDDDCIVGASDLLALLANWGPCPGRSQEPLSLEDELALHCLDLADWAIFVDKMQNGTEAEKENHLCWMLHYLEDCSKCFCTGASGCPDDDPYN